MNKAILVQAGDWEGLFVNGKLVEEGHTLNEGYDRIKYFLKLSEQYNFDLNSLIEFRVEEEDALHNCGSFPEDINDIKCKH